MDNIAHTDRLTPWPSTSSTLNRYHVKIAGTYLKKLTYPLVSNQVNRSPFFGILKNALLSAYRCISVSKSIKKVLK